MTEQSPTPKYPPFDYRQSEYLQFGADNDHPGSPKTPEDFYRAVDILADLTQTVFQHRGGNATAWDVINYLRTQNADDKAWVKWRRKKGGADLEYRAISLTHLESISDQKVTAVYSAYRADENLGPVFNEVQYIDHLIRQAIIIENALTTMRESSRPELAEVVEQAYQEVMECSQDPKQVAIDEFYEEISLFPPSLLPEAHDDFE